MQTHCDIQRTPTPNTLDIFGTSIPFMAVPTRNKQRPHVYLIRTVRVQDGVFRDSRPMREQTYVPETDHFIAK
jgi:hypothetical protein